MDITSSGWTWPVALQSIFVRCSHELLLCKHSSICLEFPSDWNEQQGQECNCKFHAEELILVCSRSPFDNGVDGK
jgi:hypothetical protein